MKAEQDVVLKGRATTAISVLLLVSLVTTVPVHSGEQDKRQGPSPGNLEGLTMPKLLKGGQPEYPPGLDKTGRLIVALTVLSTGRVRIDDVQCELDGDARDTPATCRPFIKAARKAVNQWTYSPGLVGDRPVDMSFSVPIDLNPPVNDVAKSDPDKEPLIRQADAVDYPVAEMRVTPEYPLEAVRHGREGSVVVRGRIEADGSVSNLAVVRSSPPGLFDDAALSALSRWEYQPPGDAKYSRAVEFQVFFQRWPCKRESIKPFETDFDVFELVSVCAEVLEP